MLKIEQVILVEGKYDAARLANLVEAVILTTDGFRVIKDRALQALLKRLARERGLILLTDSDAAGFKIRHFVTGLVGAQYVLQEPRKEVPGREGLLGVEGVPDYLILEGLQDALKSAAALSNRQTAGEAITYTDLYEWGISGTADSARRRRELLRRLGLPPRLSKKELLGVLNTLYTRDGLADQLREMETTESPSDK